MKFVGRYIFGSIVGIFLLIPLFIGVDFSVLEIDENVATLRDASSLKLKVESEPDLAQKWLRLVFK